MLNNKTILLIISGGIAAYKSLELIRLIKRNGGRVRCILTDGGAQFITPLSVASLSGEPCYTDLWSLKDEAEMGHIRLSREADMIVVAPASADIIAKMAHGLCNDLATTCLLATDKPVAIAPAMNPYMWDHRATQDNIKTLLSRDITVLPPTHGDMACGETGQGRLMDPHDILNHIVTQLSASKPLAGKQAIVTSGPTFEPIDPVRYIGNRSSGKQGIAIACALRDAGANVTYITGPTALPAPDGMTVIAIETATEMMQAVDKSLPTDIAICAAAVADYGVIPTLQKQKKNQGGLHIEWIENPDILHHISHHKTRPAFVVGFAAETENLIANAKQKLDKKSCDMIIANQVGTPNTPIFNQDMTSVTFITKNKEIPHSNLSKTDVASILTNIIIDHFHTPTPQKEKAA